jgi:hypothetical protein
MYNNCFDDLPLIANQIGAKGAEAIAEALKVNGYMQKLELSSIVLMLLIYLLIENQIGDKGAEAIAEALKVNGFIQHLCLSRIIL